MAVTRKRIEKNLRHIRQNIAEACARVNRSPEEVSIVAVTKSVDFETIRNALDAGLTDLGENRTQQFQSRAKQMAEYLQRRRNPLPSPVRWHMVGHLQRNKVKAVLEFAEVIHSVDSLRLAETLHERAEKMNRTVDVMMQVNCSQEQQKFGCAVGAAIHLAELITTLPCLRLTGLMTMGPLAGSADQTRHSFVRLRELFEEIRKEKIGGEHFRHLSMGMSGDYTIAVEQGATVLRIGTALFE